MMNVKSVVLLMSLTIFVTLQMMSGVVSGRLFDNTKVNIVNKLSVPVVLRCKNKSTDDGPHILLPGEKYRLIFYKAPFFTYLWSCTFEVKGKVHKFDIYDSKRDNCVDYNCFWDITKNGPCQILHVYNDTSICFRWNK
ncbi:putative plant self-incompatibility S1 [Lupinus albus]|uniref:S-protein homolog n=1 Tax=Lupinus albus TaxID=3870 RepID=A0A6A4QGD4_LUPAL|nr:putative plant self-incompatibility S1 [Lupinus albus]